MKKTLAAFLVCLALAATSPDADAARRFGGGSNLGSRPVPTFSQKAPSSGASGAAASSGTRQAQGTAQTQQNRARQTQQTPAQKPSMARSLLTGLAAALGISALLSLFGIHGAGAASLVMGIILAALLFLGFRYFVSRQRAAARPPERTEHASASWSEPPRPQTFRQEPQRSYGRASPGRSVMDEMMDDSPSPQNISQENVWEDVTPEDFDRRAFLRVARENYIALQKAWDTGNVIGISDFTTEDVFIAITHQLKARGNEIYKTEVVEVNDELLGIAREGGEYLASVRFTGRLIINGEAETVDETWVLVKPAEGPGGWLLGAIKQNGPEA